MIYLHDLLPEEISDEAAYHLVIFAMDLALALESHYFGQLKRFTDKQTPCEFPEYLKKKTNMDDPF